MRRLRPSSVVLLLISLVLASCAAAGASPSAAAPEAAEATATVQAEPSASVGLATDAREAVCETFRIVDEEIRPSYDEGFHTDDAAELGAIVSAGGLAIAALADDVSDPSVAEMIRDLGEAYDEEGQQVAAGEEVSPTASDLLTDLVVAHGQECE
jgi:hypothetical protein